MSTAKFEKLIDLIINEDQERAEQLFHEIVVEKSREIYESLMEDDLEEDQTMDLMQEIETEEEDGLAMEDEMEDEEIEGDFDVEGDDTEEFGDEEMGDELDGAEIGGDEVTKDDILDIEDKLDQLLAAFEEEFGSEEEFGDEEEEGEEEEEEEEEGEDAMVAEAVQLKQVGGATYDKFGKMGDDGAQKKSPVVANSGAKGPVGSVVKPVSFSGKAESVPTSAKAPNNAYSKGESQVKHAGAFQNAPSGAKGVKGGKGESAPAPVKSQASGVNTKDIVPESRVSKKKKI